MQNMFVGKGNLGGSPELKVIAGRNGDFQVATMRIMFGRYGRDEVSGEVQQIGGFWREVEIYGQKASDVARLLRKGSRVLVVGEERDFMAKDERGGEVQVIKIVAEDIALQLTRVERIVFAQSSGRQAQPDGQEDHAEQSAHEQSA
ncbi:single-stranded DNA-binding protein [Comamonas sp. CMM01]|uniref:single-stranded DNA-binding protein n=1 Tax=Comamonas sp. CMM01 TaxID=2769280 RepID=UPI0017817E3C|nr:single-stranded DNA-binding protein [Comamonas sp. CMM01]MBD9530862.1 single-stranded DNA-binding protein [Comamonas sp. CMM01]